MEKELVLKKKIMLFLFMNSIYFFSYFHRVAIPGTIFNQLQTGFNLTANQVATLGTIVFSIYGTLQFFVGPCMDFFGTNRIFLSGGFLLCIGSLIFSFSHSIFFLYFSRILIGFGASVMYLGMVKKTDELFGPDFFPVMLGVALFLGYSGGLFATLPFERLVTIFGWRNTILWMAIIFLVVLFVILFVLLKHGQLRYQKNSISFEDIKATFLNRKSYPLVITVSINFAIYFLFQGLIGKKLLQDICSVSSKIAASFTFAMMVNIMFFVLFWGAMTRLIKKRKEFVVSLCMIQIFSCALMIVNLILWKVPMIFFISFFLFAMIGGSGPLTTTLMKEINPSTVGTSVGFINALCYIFVAITGNISGFIMDRFSQQAIITSEAVIYPVSAYIAIVVFCLFLSFVSLATSLKIVEEHREFKVEIPAPS
ncbi:MAG: MFS transporter [bacterium]|nr:MFS transporter [bacterium]